MAYEPVVTDAASRNGAVKSVIWSNLPANTQGDWIEWGDFSLRTAVVSGTLGGATVSLVGSNDWPGPPTNQVTLTTWQGTACSTTTAPAVFTPRDVPLWTAPLVSGGAGASVTVALSMHRADISTIG